MKFCTACGTRAEDASDRWCGVCGSAFAEAPAAPGPLAPYAPANQVASAPSPGWGVGPDIGDGPASTGAPAMLGREWPQDPDQAARRSRKKTPMVIGGALAGVIGVVGIGFGAVKLMSDPTGADSPEAAVRSVLDAISGQDPVAAVRVINPDEARGLDNTVNLTVQRIKKAGFDQGGRFTDAIDVQFVKPSFEVEPLGDGAAKVVIDARIDASFDPAKLPDHMQDDPDLAADSISEDLDDLLEGSPYTDWDKERTEVYLVAVEQDGRWYVSPTATALELMADEADVPGGDFDADTLTSPDPAAATPDDAVSGLLQAVESQDLAEASGFLVDGQGDLVRAYRESVEALLRQHDTEWSVEATARTTSEASGGRAIVTIDQASLSGSISDGYDSEYGTLAVDGDCLEVDGQSECIGDELEDVTGIKDFQVVTIKEDGNWRVDLYGTVLRYLEGAAKNLPQDAVAQALDAPFLAEPQRIATGEDVEVEFDRLVDDRVPRVIEVPATEGQVLRLWSPTQDKVYFERVRGGQAFWPESGGYLMVPIERTGPVRILVQGHDRSVTVRADLVDPTPISDGEELTPGEVYAFTGDGSLTYATSDGSSLWACRLEDGTCRSGGDYANYESSWDGNYLIGTPDTGVTAPVEDDSYDEYDDDYDY